MALQTETTSNSNSKSNSSTFVSRLLNLPKEVWKLLGQMRFAVFIILVFAVMLIYGTTLESLNGRDYANKAVYKSWWFMLTQFFMFASIFIATIDRLPFKKALAGFYTLHLGLLILFLGSFVTYQKGVDAMIELLPLESTNRVLLDEDILQMRKADGTTITFDLPYSHRPQNVNTTFENIEVQKYIPSIKNSIEWIESDFNSMSVAFKLYNDMVMEDVVMSLNPQSDFQSQKRLGPLSLHLMPHTLSDCFKEKRAYIFWDIDSGKCLDLSFKTLKGPKNEVILNVQYKHEELNFFPQYSPLALDKGLKRRIDIGLRIFDKGLFEERPTLFLFGEELSYFSKGRKKWVHKKATLDQDLQLPWMNFKLRLQRATKQQVPLEIPSYTKPIQDSGEIIEGQEKAVLIKVGDNSYWVKSSRPLLLQNGKDELRFTLTKKVMRLPYELTLDHFKMNTNPGTRDPASYESFVYLDDKRQQEPAKKHHIFMNNPLKYDQFTFYQSSYFDIGQGRYGSALTVNYDPGRPWKYLGSLLLVLGSFWHFVLRGRRNRRKKTTIKNEVTSP